MSYLPVTRDHYTQHGLNGWFGSFVKNLCNMAIGVVSGYVSQLPGGKALVSKFTAWWDSPAVQGAFDTFKTAAVAELPAADQAFINAWNDKSFIPWLTALTLELKAAVELTNIVARLAAMNIVLDKIAAVKEHYELYDNAKLTANGADARSYLIETGVAQLLEVIKYNTQELNGVSYPVKFNPAKYSFTPLFAGTPLTAVTVINYKLPQGSSAPATGSTPPPAAPAPTAPTAPAAPATIPAIIPGTTTGIKTPAAATVGGTKTQAVPAFGNNTGVATVKTAPATAINPEVTKTPAPAAKSNTGLVVGGLILAGVLWYATRKKSKTKEK